MPTIGVEAAQNITVQLVTAPTAPTISITEGVPGPRGLTGPQAVDGNDGEDAPHPSEYVDRVNPGQLTGSRDTFTSTAAPASQKLVLTYFTAARQEIWTSASVITGTTVPNTITLGRIGLYAVDATTEDLTLVAATVNDTALFATQSSLRTKAFAVAIASSVDSRYALGILVVATTTPNFVTCGAGGVAAVTAAEKGIKPRMTAELAGQADLPSTVANSALATADRSFYGRLS